jgi:hypothetical protein
LTAPRSLTGLARFALAGVVLAAVVLASCTTIPRTAVPTALIGQAELQGVGDVRAWGDTPRENPDQLLATRFAQIRKHRPEILASGRSFAYLALSGGGANGAFGAGFLNGWTASGQRPTFEVVSGVSAGALIAPFAFLGPAYDKQLRDIYTLYSTNDIARPQVLAGVAGSHAIMDTTPLKSLIAHYVDRDVVRAVASEHAKGRRLLVGTTNIDADRAVVWDMGRIAQHPIETALPLFRAVLLASAALPGLFPPVYLNVAAGGQVFQEMHVDGGTTENAFLLPLHLDLKTLDKRAGRRIRRKLYIIANDKTGPSPGETQNTAFGIASRSIATLIKQQLEGDLIKLYLRARENQIDYNLASIPLSFMEKSEEPFDRSYMRKLYELGFNMSRRKFNWSKKPPGI